MTCKWCNTTTTCEACWNREIPEEVTTYHKGALTENDVIAPADMDVFTMFANAQADMDKDMDEIAEEIMKPRFVVDESCETSETHQWPKENPHISDTVKENMETNKSEVLRGHGRYPWGVTNQKTTVNFEDAVQLSRDEITKLLETVDKAMNKIDTPKIICVSGKAQHGKDTSAGILKDILEKCGYRVLITHYGDLVKYVCKTFFDWNGEKDEAGRGLLQFVGTDRVRAQRPNYWVDFVVSIVQMFPDQWDYVIIPDSRFPNEIDCFKEAGFDVTHARVIRAPFVSPLTPEQQMHSSESALDGVRADVYITNFGSLSDLTGVIEDVLLPVISFKEEIECQ